MSSEATERDRYFRKSKGVRKNEALGWTANLLICNDDNNVKSPKRKGRQSAERSNRTSSVAFSDCFSTVTFSFYFPLFCLWQGLEENRHRLWLSSYPCIFSDGVMTCFQSLQVEALILC